MNTSDPVDYAKEFHKSGMTLITDPRSDRYLRKTDESSKLDPPLQEGEKEKT
jgi:hypothetical protein